MLGLRPSTSVPFVAPAREPADAAGGGALFAAKDSEVERLRDMIAHLMHKTAHDPLTALPTRGVLLEQLEQELARDPSDGAQIAILFVDLDNFKLVNDSLGHGCGDAVLREMADRIVDCIGPEDIASRFGGDEMVVLHARATDQSGVTLGNHILAALTEPMLVSGKEVVVSASVGVALCKPGLKSVEQLLREADTALYAAKDRGRARLEQFNDELQSRTRRHLARRLYPRGRRQWADRQNRTVRA
jgi:diguanylate cyclase (GGDEF)-like protein